MTPKKIIVIGGGPAGMMAAIRAAQLGASVTIVEKNAALGKKLLLTGKGRCNLTNACDLNSFLKSFRKNGPFLRDAFKNFFNQELMEFFESRGLKLNVERQERVFPKSNRSLTVLEVLKAELQKNNVEFICRAAVKKILVHQGRATVVILTDGKSLAADAFILATGGVSYAFTGSTGDGIKMAAELGHKIVPTLPGLVALETEEKFVKQLTGLTLKNIRLHFTDGKWKLDSPIGEMLFTESGISGPLVLSLSSEVAGVLAQRKKVRVDIDLKPALSYEQLDARFRRDFLAQPKKIIKNLLKDFLPSSLIDIFIQQANIRPEKEVNQIRQDERKKMVELLKAFALNIRRTLPIEEAMVTQGGVALSDIDPRTMESRLVKNLYFAGEIIDVDGDTGGFNLQAAFSTGYLAGQSAAS